MKNYVKSLFLCTLIASSSLFAEAKTKAEPSKAPLQAAQPDKPTAQPIEIARLSEAFGHVIGKNLENIGVKFDMAQVIKGLQDAMAGKESPMSEMECIQAIASVQEKVFKEQCSENLKKAETFLSNNSKTEGVVALEEGKVQYRVVQKGTGDKIESHYTPLIRYTGKHLDGSVFGSSKEDESISLDEVIPGLKAGLLGMREGEKRTVFIHPDLAYGTNGYLPPNSLLTFEVEIVKANSPLKDAVEKDPSSKREIAEVKTDIR